jgi:hypothetical protein
MKSINRVSTAALNTSASKVLDSRIRFCRVTISATSQLPAASRTASNMLFGGSTACNANSAPENSNTIPTVTKMSFPPPTSRIWSSTDSTPVSVFVCVEVRDDEWPSPPAISRSAVRCAASRMPAETARSSVALSIIGWSRCCPGWIPECVP